jgi:hypothetical protein
VFKDHVAFGFVRDTGITSVEERLMSKIDRSPTALLSTMPNMSLSNRRDISKGSVMRCSLTRRSSNPGNHGSIERQLYCTLSRGLLDHYSPSTT